MRKYLLITLSLLALTVATTANAEKTTVYDCVITVGQDQFLFWDESDGTCDGAAAGTNLVFNGNDVNVDTDLSNYDNSVTQFISAGSAPVLSVNGETGVVTLDTDDIPEGALNFYY